MRDASYLELGEKVVVCCSHEINRSNGIALGLLVQYSKMLVTDSVERNEKYTQPGSR